MQGSASFNILSNTVDIGGSSVSAFGTLETAELTPLVQLDFVYGINTQTGVTAVSGAGATVDTSVSRLRIQSGTNAAGTATFTSRKTAKYRPGQGLTARFTGVYAAATAGAIQIIGAGSATDGYFFGYNGTSFGILLKTGGSSAWVASSSWNGDKCDGTGGSGFTWNHQNGNVMMIKYPYLGYGDIKYYVQNPTTGGWILCHTIQYANSTTAVQVSNSNLTFYANITNGGNTTNLTMYVGSVGIFLSGARVFVGNPKWSADSNKASITTETSILTIKNCTTYNGVANKSLIRLNAVSFGSTAGNGVCTLRLKIGATLGGSPSYTPVNGTTSDAGATLTAANSIASVDTAGTTVTNGTYVFSLTAANPASNVFDLTTFDIFLAPGETMTLSVATSQSAATVGVTANWVEDI